MRSTQRAFAPLMLSGLVALLAACGSDDDPVTEPADTLAGDTGPDVSADAVPQTDGDDDAGPSDPGPAPEGTRVIMDLSSTSFWGYPYPSDRRVADGRLPIDGVGNPADVALFAPLLEVAADRDGFPTIPVAWFRFDGEIGERSEADVIAASIESPILLVDIDPDSPERGRLVPVVARTLPTDPYTPTNVLAVAPRPGFVLTAGRQWAFVVRRSLGDSQGSSLGVPDWFWAVAHGQDHAEAASHAALFETLETLGVSPDTVASASIFTTSDVVKDLFELSEQVLADYAPDIENLAVDPDDGADHERFCELHGTIDVPVFQKGIAPFNTEGLFEVDGQGKLVLQRTETIPVVVTVPNQAMPEGGFPLVVYWHGSGGISTQLVDRGPRLFAGGPNTKGEGPAWVLAGHGMAAASSALPVNPERVPGASGIAYLNFSNLKAFRDTFRQGVIEQRLLLSALLRLEITPGLCPKASVPESADAITFRADPVYGMGQSMGGMYTNMIGAVEPRLKALVPTGAGGFWSYFILQTSLVPGADVLLQGLLGTPEPLSFMHPAMHVVETAWEPSEPLVYMPRLGRRPLPDHPVRAVYEPVGKGDEYFPIEIYDAVALAYGHEQAGEAVWTSMNAALSLDGLDTWQEYPVSTNVQSADGTAYTGVVVQYEGDGIDDPHVIFAQLDDVRHQYGCFFETHLTTGTATVVAPQPLGTPCTP